MTYLECFKSIFQNHNEFGNIWTHLLPLYVLSFSIAIGLLPVWRQGVLIFYLTMIPIGICLFSSVMYHTCMAQVDHYRSWLCFDVAAIYLLFVGIVPASFVWGLQCQPALLNTCCIVYITVLIGGLMASLRGNSPFGRALPMFILLTVRLTVFGLRVYLGRTNSLPVVWYIFAETSAVVGGIVNILKIPEKWVAPDPEVKQGGLFDYWFNSHQIMHVLVVVSISCFIQGACIDHQLNTDNLLCKQQL
eukprot:TRINITY_DN71671_c0_g1_i1.p1 TRINITY_DN71671_c0_g1~~TRINITY_DN71671_c0_g1_i1.p1  ORF type:complete len:283 (+),score=13.17 TRINITY_DN71671_c0_g1_i1:109-849(+)